jgi:hypothetical protein
MRVPATGIFTHHTNQPCTNIHFLIQDAPPLRGHTGTPRSTYNYSCCVQSLQRQCAVVHGYCAQLQLAHRPHRQCTCTYITAPSQGTGPLIPHILLPQLQASIANPAPRLPPTSPTQPNNRAQGSPGGTAPTAGRTCMTACGRAIMCQVAAQCCTQ